MPTIEELIKTKPISDPYQRMILNVMYTGNWLQQQVSQVLKPIGLTEPQYNVLRILRGQHGGAMNLYEIQSRMLQKMSNVSRLLDKLVAKGLVTRTECEKNRRRVDVAITGGGLKVLDDIEPAMLELMDKVAANVDQQQAELIGNKMDDLRNI